MSKLAAFRSGWVSLSQGFRGKGSYSEPERQFQESNEQLKSNIFCYHLKMRSNGDAMASGGNAFQTRAAATPKARSSTVRRRAGGMFNTEAEHGLIALPRIANVFTERTDETRQVYVI